MKNEVTFEPLSSWQKPDCINKHLDFECPNEAVQEAVMPFVGGIAKVRCCKESKCEEVAISMAKASADAVSAVRLGAIN